MTWADAERVSAERLAIGCLMLHGPGVGEDHLRPEQFLNEECRIVFEAIRRASKERRATDPAVVVVALKQVGKLSEVGGVSFVVDCVEMALDVSKRDVREVIEVILEEE